ncbi:cyclopropane fatty acyl phospholipid synthase [Marinomonas sp. THO17]|uniref:cyclopropane fatty acyl phospholipid synthase n=1 Tax=Marinomonas sp. THO17 TaxID=3149048 RepID=UPI00336BB704
MNTPNQINEETSLSRSSPHSSLSDNSPPPLSVSPIEKWFSQLLNQADIKVNGPNAWDPQVHNPDLWNRILKEGSIGLGEAYMEGWWDCKNLEECIRRLLSAELDRKIIKRRTLLTQWLKAKLFNRQSVKRAYQVGEQHYDVGNDLYQAMLDPTMAYSCGYWENANDLHQAQLNKLRLICQKLHLQATDSIIEIGCGWGSFAELAAREYGAHVTGVTISKEQVKLAKERCKDLPVDIRLMDYRSLEGEYDKAVSIGMFEHVGRKNYPLFMQTAHRLIKDNGIFLLHTIGSDISSQGTDPWIDKYIFPNGVIPSLTDISEAVEPYFVIEDVHNFGQDYAKTLLAWQQNVDHHWTSLQSKYNDRFYRMWSYYLKTCAGAFQSRSLQLYQVVLRKRRVPLSRYQSPR